MQYANVSRLSTALLPFNVDAFLNGQVLDPSTGTVEFAFFTNPLTEPTDSDWHTGSWDTTVSGNYVAMADPGAVPLTIGGWYPWIKITNPQTSEVFTEQLGKIKVY